MPLLKRVSHASAFLLAFFLARSVLSVLLKTSMTTWFGAGAESDAYFAAFTIPQQLSDFFIGGILFAAIIPVFQRRRQEITEAEASNEMSALLNITFTVLVLMTAGYFLAAPWIVRTVFSGFTGETLAMTIHFSRMLSPAILLFGLSLIYTSLFHAFRDFVVPSLAALLFPASSIAAIWLLPSAWGIERLIYGNLVGIIAGLLLLIFRIGARMRWRWNWNWRNPLIASILLLSWPVLLENITLKILPLIKFKIASELSLDGAITLLQLALFVISSTAIFISGPIATAVFPHLGQQQAEKNPEMFSSYIKAVNIILLLAAPLAMILLMQSHAVVSLAFGYGKFSDGDCAVTARLIAIASLAILPQCFQSISGRMFYILQQTKLASFASIALIALTWPLYFLFARWYGIDGLMGALVGISYVGVAVNFAILQHKLRGNSFLEFYRATGKLILAASAMGAVMLALKHALPESTPAIFSLAVTAAAGFAAFAITNAVLKHGEFKYLLNECRVKLKVKP
jgi:putative peptidoglycan lipid II flippase